MPEDDDTDRAGEFAAAFMDFVRGFGLLDPERTPCGAPMSPAEAHALTILRAGGMTQGALGERLKLGKSTTSRLVDGLEQHGWARREPHPRDGRARMLVLTDKGNEVAATVAQRRATRLSALLDHVPPDERPKVIEALPTFSRKQDVMRLRKLAATVAALLITLGACAGEDPRQTSRQEAVADHPDDTTQVDLVRQHLTAEADRFRAGDFGDPASIHGDDMPGLAALSAGAADIEITYADVPDGATLTFRTTDSELVEALHDWGEAQVSDHGAHAETGTR